MPTVRIVTAIGDAEREASLAGAFATYDEVDLVLRCVDRVELLGAVRGVAPDAIVSVGLPVWLDKQTAEEAALRGIRLMGLVADPLDAERLAALGATLVSADASVDEVIARCRRSEVRPPLPSTQPTQPRGKLIAVWGPKGAAGRTTLAVELAAELAATEPETLLLDADPYGGDVLQLLGVVEERPTIVWAAQMAAKDELDAARLTIDLRRAYRSGPVVLPGLTRPDLWPEVSEFGWRELLTVAKATFCFTVCDVGFCLEADLASFPVDGDGRNRIARAAVARAEQIVAICRADPVGIKNFLWGFEHLRALADPDAVSIVANRVRPNEQREVGDLIRRHIGKRPVAYVPDRPHDFRKAVAAGMPLHTIDPGSDVAATVRALAAALGASLPARGLLARLAGRT